MLSERLENLHPYVPGEQPKDREYIKLNANENPYPPCSRVGAAIKKAASRQRKKLGLYPDPDSLSLRSALADMLNKTGGVLCNSEAAKKQLSFEITPEMIFCGNGSDEVLSFIFYTFFGSRHPLVLPEFTYSFYPVYCGFYNIPMLKIPLKKDWSLDTEKMLDESEKNGSPIILANPNAPTGITLSHAEIEQLLKKIPSDRILVVDEAYADFAEESCLGLLKDYKNLVIVRTFSKSFSLAGMRLGFAVSNPELIKSVFTVKNSFNHFPVDFLAQTAGKAACENYSYYEKNAKKIVAERISFSEFLRSRNWFVIESRTNFVFAKKDGISGKSVYERVKNSGILIRRFDTPGIEDFLRISIGTKQQMEKLKKVLSEI
ncbi:histidinol-phosphate transaminase [Treponema sp.]|uniref:histidinol-phosphate transaminase n=1 Tax=Treponema sp. TaxID=166 RepID=UPI003F07E2FC